MGGNVFENPQFIPFSFAVKEEDYCEYDNKSNSTLKRTIAYKIFDSRKN